MLRAILVLALPFLLCASTREDKLVDALIKAQRSVERANLASEQAGAALTSFCQHEGKQMRVKTNGLIGCMVVGPPNPKPESDAPAKPSIPPVKPVEK